MKIEKSIPMPEAWNKYPFKDMDIGDSFLVEGDVVKVRNAAHAWGKVNNKKFSVKKVEGGHRCWRIS